MEVDEAPGRRFSVTRDGRIARTSTNWENRGETLRNIPYSRVRA